MSMPSIGGARTALAALVVALAAALGLAGSAPAATTTNVRIAVIPAFGSLPVKVAAVKGFYARNGLKVTVTPIQDPAAAMAALGKQFDVSLAAPPTMINGAARGLPVQAITGMQVVSQKNRNSVLVAKAPIRSYRDLQGKRVGLISLSGSSFAALAYNLQKAGVNQSSVTFSAVPAPTMADQVRAGRIDAAVSAVPFFTGLNDLWVGTTDVLADAVSALTKGKQKTTHSAILVTDKNWAAGHRTAVAGFRKAISQAMTWIQRNPSKARAVLSAWTKIPVTVVKASPTPGFSVTLSPSTIQEYIDLGKATKTLPGGLPSARSMLVPGIERKP